MKTPYRAAFAAACLAIVGCAPDYDVSFDVRTAPPLAPEVTGSTIRVAEGIAFGAAIIPTDGGDPLGTSAEIEVISQNPDVASVVPMDLWVGEEEGPTWNHRIAAHDVGEAVLTVFVNDDGDDFEIDALVIVEAQNP